MIAAFRATLEELSEADLLIHVVDLTSHNAAEQCDTVESILKDLNLSEKPRITAMNKIDLLLPSDQKWEESKAIEYMAGKTEEPAPNTVLVSAAKKWGFTKLLALISQMITKNTSIEASTSEYSN